MLKRLVVLRFEDGEDEGLAYGRLATPSRRICRSRAEKAVSQGESGSFMGHVVRKSVLTIPAIMLFEGKGASIVAIEEASAGLTPSSWAPGRSRRRGHQ